MNTSLDLLFGPPGPPVSVASTNTAPFSSVGGWRFRPDASSDLLFVTIIVDAEKTSHYTVAEIADYVAMLAYLRTEDYDDCNWCPALPTCCRPTATRR